MPFDDHQMIVFLLLLPLWYKPIKKENGEPSAEKKYNNNNIYSRILGSFIRTLNCVECFFFIGSLSSAYTHTIDTYLYCYVGLLTVPMLTIGSSFSFSFFACLSCVQLHKRHKTLALVCDWLNFVSNQKLYCSK